MNEFSAKKLGEAIAFEKEGQRILARSEKALEPYLGAITPLQTSLATHAETATRIAKGEGVEEQTLAKADKTGEKLQKLALTYVGDDWDDAAEVMEWLGFLEGAAIVHWSVVQGVCETTKTSDLAVLANQAVDFHKDNLKKVGVALKALAKDRSK